MNQQAFTTYRLSLCNISTVNGQKDKTMPGVDVYISGPGLIDFQ